MEPNLVEQLKTLPARYAALPSRFKTGIIVGAVLALLSGVVGAAMAGSGSRWQYLYTSLSDSDAQDAARILAAHSIPYRLDAANKALAVSPDDQGRAALLLSAEGLPHGAADVVGPTSLDGTEVTKEKLRNAREAKLGQILSSMGELRTARVIISEPKRRLLPGQDVPASASVMVRLHPGRKLNRRQIAGIQYFIASAVQHLEPEGVALIDGEGTMLSSSKEDLSGSLEFRAQEQREIEEKILAVLRPLVQEGKVVAQVHIQMDDSRVEERKEVYDADNPALATERNQVEKRSRAGRTPGGVTGAAANDPVAAGSRTGGPSGAGSERSDERKDYLVGKTVTVSSRTAPRLVRMTVAVLVDSPADAPKAATELALYEKLAKQAAGFSLERGDVLTLTALPFYAEPAKEAAEPAPNLLPLGLSPVTAALLAGVLLVLLVGAALLWRRRQERENEQSRSLALLNQGGPVAEIEKKLNPTPEPEPLPEEVVVEEIPEEIASPEDLLREAAIVAVQEDPRRAAYLLRAWLRESVPQTEGAENELARAA